MERKYDEAVRDKKIDHLVEVHAGLDDACKEIFFTLIAYKRLRFNQLLRTLKKLDVKITQPTLKEHLDHLLEKELIDCEKGFQTASYGLTDEVKSLVDASPEYLKRWIEEQDKNAPEYLKPLKITGRELFSRLSDMQLDKMAVDDLGDVLSLNLFELKTFIEYDLKVDKFKSNADFWSFVGNPMHRMFEKSVAERCRDSERYRKLLFEKIDILISELRSDKELFRKRKEKGHRN